MSPNVIGYVSEHSVDLLTINIQAFLDNATTGVIFVDFGCQAKHNELLKTKLDVFLKAFGQLKQNVLWRFDADTTNLSLPPNVQMTNCLPENQEILAHKNVVLFITNGEENSNQAPSTRNIRMLLIPFFGGEQYRNAIKSIVSEKAVMLRFGDVTKESLIEKLNVILSSKKHVHFAKDLRRTHSYSTDSYSDSTHSLDFLHQHTKNHQQSNLHDLLPIHLHLDILGALFFVILILVKISLKFCRIYNSCEWTSEETRSRKLRKFGFKTN